MSLVEQIANSSGQPVTARIGTVVSTAPFRVQVQGQIFNEVGLIGAAPGLGAVVLLLGQAVKGSKSSGSSWVVMGEITSTA